MARVTSTRPPIGKCIGRCLRLLNAYSVRRNNIASQSRALLLENSVIFHVFEDIQAFSFVIPHSTGFSRADCDGCAGIP